MHAPAHAPVVVGLSLLSLGAGTRLLGVAGLLAVLWLLVAWALS